MATCPCASSSSLVLVRAGIARYDGSVAGAGAGRRQQHALSPSGPFPRASSGVFAKPSLASLRSMTRARTYAAAPSSSQSAADKEEIFFDGGPHIGDLLANLVFGLTLLWLPLTLASVFRALFLRYRFSNVRVTVMSGLTGSDRKDFSYKVIKDVKYVPRFIGEWGDVVITLNDGTQVELKSVPRFREIAQYCIDTAAKEEGRSAVVGKRTPG